MRDNLFASFSRRMFPLVMVQIITFFSIYALKFVAVMTAAARSGDLSRDVLLLILTFIAGALLNVVLVYPVSVIADKLPKRYILMICAFIDLLLSVYAGIAIVKYESFGIMHLVYVLLAMDAVNSFRSPAVSGILPETFDEENMTRANGILKMSGLLAAMAGLLAAPSLFALFKSGGLIVCLNTFILLFFLEYVFAVAVVPVISDIQLKKELSYRPRYAWKKGFAEFRRTSSLKFASMGGSFAVAIAVALQIVLVVFVTNALGHGPGNSKIALLQLAPLFGLAAGYLLTGLLSRRKIELGLVPFGAAGMAIFMTLAAFFPGRETVLSLAVPGIFNVTLYIHASAFFWLFLSGASSGLFIVPLKTYYQQRTKGHLRGSALAVANSVEALIILVIDGLMLIAVSPYIAEYGLLPSALAPYVAHVPKISPKIIMVSLGLLAFLPTIISMWALPDFALRFLIIMCSHTVYRLRVIGAENIPSRGPALLLSNHVSYIDNVLICACTSRRVRFLMHEDFFAVPFLNFLARMTGFIKVPAGGHKSMQAMFDKVKEALRNDDIVCVFPEGRITSNGIMGAFKSGYEHMLPDDDEKLDVPIIPVCISNVWGSMFSKYFGDIKLRCPKKGIPHFATVSFGKPLPKGISAYDVRQTVSEMSAEAAMAPMPQERVLHYQAARNAKRFPFRTIMRDADGKKYSAFKIYMASIIFSREIKARTSSECRYVGMLLPNCGAAAISLLGTLYADKVPCPLNFTTSQSVFERSVKKAKISLILTSRRFLSKIRIKETPEMVFLEDLAKSIPWWKKIFYFLLAALMPYKELLNIICPLSKNDVNMEGALLFSSGSTGDPKGVMLTHHNINSDVDIMLRSVAVDINVDAIMGNLPLFHSFGLCICFWIPLTCGCPVIFVPSPLDANTVGDCIQKYKATILCATPSFLQTYMRKIPVEKFASLRLVITGAERLRQDIALKFQQVMQGRLEITEGYGCTELSPVATINLPSNIEKAGLRTGKAGTIGAVLPDICARVMDPLTFKPLPPDTEGLMFIKGPTVMKGYLNDKAQTDKVLINGYYNTGDIVKMDEEGFITICGRLSRFSKIAGEMVPHEMVECIINEMCGLEARVVAVCGIPDAQKGEALLVLYTPEMPLTPEQVVDDLRERSISNLWIPKASNFYKVDALPILGTGKLDLIHLRKIAEQVAEERKRAGLQKSVFS